MVGIAIYFDRDTGPDPLTFVGSFDPKVYFWSQSQGWIGPVNSSLFKFPGYATNYVYFEHNPWY